MDMEGEGKAFSQHPVFLSSPSQVFYSSGIRSVTVCSFPKCLCLLGLKQFFNSIVPSLIFFFKVLSTYYGPVSVLGDTVLNKTGNV